MVAVEIVDDPQELAGRTAGQVVCCIVPRSDQAAVRSAMQAVGVPASAQQRTARSARYEHPDVRERDGWIVASLCGVTEGYEPEPWTFMAGEQALLVVGEGASHESLRAAVEHYDGGDVRVALAAALLGLARAATETLDRVTIDALDRDGASTGFSRAAERSQIREIRSRLFALQEMFAAQALLMEDDEELSDVAGPAAARLLRHGRSLFGSSRSLCARLYALAGDLMTEQNALVNERLTLVSTFFLPLTVSTGFFGMNFGWMTDRVGGLTAFLILGIGGPVLSTALTLAVVRRMGASGQ